MSDETTVIRDGTTLIRRNRCGNCNWFDGGPEDSAAYRRHPFPPHRPVLMLLEDPPKDRAGKPWQASPTAHMGDRFIYDVAEDDAAEYRHPWTNFDDWCGEWVAASENDWEPAYSPGLRSAVALHRTAPSTNPPSAISGDGPL